MSQGMFLTGCNNGVWGRNLPGEERGNHRATKTIMQYLGAATEKKILSTAKF